MASDWQTAHIPLVGGLDTKTDEGMVQPPSLTILENGIFKEHGSIATRPGYRALGTQSDAGAAIANPHTVFGRGDELVALANEAAYSYDTLNDKWLALTGYRRVSASYAEVPPVKGEQTAADRGCVNGIVVYAWEDSRGGVRASVYSNTTGSPYSVDFVVDADGASPRVLALNNYIHILYVDTATDDLNSLPINVRAVADSISGGVVTIASDLNSNHAYDAAKIPGSDQALVVYVDDDGTPNLTGIKINDKADSGGSWVAAKTDFAVSTPTILSIDVGEDYFGMVTTAGSTAVTLWRVNHTDGVWTDDSTTVSSLGADVQKVACALYDDGNVQAFYELEGSRVNLNQVNTTVYDFEGSSTTLADTVWVRRAGLASATWSPRSYPQVVLKHDSEANLQNSYFLYEADTEGTATLVGQLFYGLATNIVNADTRLPRPHKLSATRWNVALPFRRRLDVTNEDVFAFTGVADTSFDYSHKPQVAEAGDSTYLTGVMAYQYDGRTFAEQGFLLFPEPQVTIGDTTHTAVDVATSGNVEVGTHGYRIYYMYRDSTGRQVRSAAVAFNVEVSSSAKEVTITIPTLAHTGRDKDEVYIVVYRTKAGGSTYYRVSGVDPTTTTGDNRFIFNDSTADTVSFTDNLADADIEANELDFQNSGEIEPISAGAPTLLASGKRRLFAAGGTLTTNTVQYSKLFTAGLAVEFNEVLAIPVPAAGGDITAIATLDDKVIIFKENLIYAAVGDGLDNTLTSGSFSEAEQINSDVGCSSATSVVAIPNGLLFKSNKGFRLLDRSLQVHYIGAPVEDYNADDVTGAVTLPDDNQVLFLSSSGTTLMYDYFFNKWSVFTNHRGESSALVGDTYYYVRPDSNAVWYRDTEWYRDGNSTYKTKLRLAPIRPDGIQGWWRCRRVYIAGDYKSQHTLRLNVYFNRELGAYESTTWDTSDIITDTTWGSSDTWGSDSYWGGSDTFEYQWSYRLARQKCQTVSFELELLPDTSANGANAELNEIAIEWAAMGNLARLPASRRN